MNEGHRSGIRTGSLDDPAGDLAALLDEVTVEGVEIPHAALGDVPFRDLVSALLDQPGFRLEFRGQTPDAVLAMVADKLLDGGFAAERAMLAEQIERLEAFARNLAGGGIPQTAIRTYFAPGDLVWHLDRQIDRIAFRLLWPIGRPAGMIVTAADNIDLPRHLAFMRHEHPLLGQLDTNVLRTGAAAEELWAHRPHELEMMKSGDFPFIIDPDRVWQFDANAITIHRVDTPGHPGTYHRSSWANRHSPGLQIVVTVAAD